MIIRNAAGIPAAFYYITKRSKRSVSNRSHDKTLTSKKRPENQQTGLDFVKNVYLRRLILFTKQKKQ